MASDPARSSVKSFRQRMPEMERLAWALLRDRRLAGVKFRRQVPIGPYIIDFVCLRRRLVVELDGPFHNAGADAARDAWFGSQGFKVLRLRNIEVRDRLVPAILEALGDRRPSPLAGEGGARTRDG